MEDLRNLLAHGLPVLEKVPVTLDRIVDGARPVTAAQRRPFNVVLLAVEEIDLASNAEEWRERLAAVVEATAKYTRDHPHDARGWLIQAACALSHGSPSLEQNGILAARQLQRLGVPDLDDRIVARFVARLDRKEWFTAKTAQEIAAAKRLRLRWETAPMPPPPAKAAWVNSLNMGFVSIGNVMFSIYETRVEDYMAFVLAAGSDKMGSQNERKQNDSVAMNLEWTPQPWQEAGHPAVEVSWYDAKRFCDWLTNKERQDGRLTADQSYRLPSDDEWSAANGLTVVTYTGDRPMSVADLNPRFQTEEEFQEQERKKKAVEKKAVYPWGKEWPPPPGAGNYFGVEAEANKHRPHIKQIEGYRDGFPKTAPVGSFRPNEFGLYDMSGNVKEWCEDSINQDGSDLRSQRGAHWGSSDPWDLDLTRRSLFWPAIPGPFVGFRVVLVGKPTSERSR